MSVGDPNSGPHAGVASGINHWAVSPASVQLFHIVVQNILIYRVHAQTPYDNATHKVSPNVLYLRVNVGLCSHISCVHTGYRLAMRGRACTSFQFSFFFPSTDLKKTLAVLLDNILQRIGKLESKVDNLVNGTGGNSTNSTTAVPSLVSLEKINVAGKDGCSLPSHGTEPFLKPQHQGSYWGNKHSVNLM